MDTALKRAITARYVDTVKDCEVVEVTVDGVATRYRHFDDNVWEDGASETTADKEVVQAVQECVHGVYAANLAWREQQDAERRRERIARLKSEAADYGVSVDTLLIVEAIGRVEQRIHHIGEVITAR